MRQLRHVQKESTNEIAGPGRVLPHRHRRQHHLVCPSSQRSPQARQSNPQHHCTLSHIRISSIGELLRRRNNISTPTSSTHTLHGSGTTYVIASAGGGILVGACISAATRYPYPP